MRHPSDHDGMEPRLHFRLSNGNDMVIVLPIGVEWEQQIIAMTRTQPFVIQAELLTWNGQLLLNLRQDIPYPIKPQKGEG